MSVAKEAETDLVKGGAALKLEGEPDDPRERLDTDPDILWRFTEEV